jgi:hypothetical protein
LDPDRVVDLFRVQIEAAKAVERAMPDVSVPADVSLAQLRVAVTAATDRFIAEITRSEPWLHDAGAPDRLGATLHSGLTAPGLSAGWAERLRASLLRVHRAHTDTPGNP